MNQSQRVSTIIKMARGLLGRIDWIRDPVQSRTLWPMWREYVSGIMHDGSLVLRDERLLRCTETMILVVSITINLGRGQRDICIHRRQDEMLDRNRSLGVDCRGSHDWENDRKTTEKLHKKWLKMTQNMT